MATDRVGLEGLLTMLTQAHVKYAFLDGHERLPTDYPARVNMLTDNVPAVVRMLGLRNLGGSRNPIYILDEYKLEIALRQKGSGYLPEQFEAEILARAVVKDRCFRHLDLDHSFWYTMWKLVYFTDTIRDLNTRRILDAKLKERIGTGKLSSMHSHDTRYYPANHKFMPEVKEENLQETAAHAATA